MEVLRVLFFNFVRVEFLKVWEKVVGEELN